MNRSIALFVALAMLLAHVLAIHEDGEGNFAFPYEQAYTAFRLGKSLVQDGFVQWGADGGGVESCASLAWIGVAALGEAFTNHVNLFCQNVGIVSALLCAVLLSRFRHERSAGLIAPLLFVSSGAAAAASASGMEGTLFVFALLASLWALERKHPLLLVPALVLVVLVRAEGVLYAGALLAVGGFAEGGKPRARLLVAGGAAGLAFLASALAWKASSSTAWHPVLRALVEPHPRQAADGLASLVDLLRIAFAPLLALFTLLYLARGRLGGMGLRALALALFSFVLVVLQGRSPLPFGQAFLPALAFLYLAIQEGLIAALDGRMLVRRAALGSLLVVLVLSALASKSPGDIGPLRTGALIQAWTRGSGSARAGYEQPLASAGLVEEIRNTNRLRAVGIFLRDRVDPASTCLSPWPSAIAYLSHVEVADLLARAHPMPGVEARGSWTRRERGDVVAALEGQRDFVVPRIGWSAPPPSLGELAREWLREFDARADEPGRVEAVERALASYELVTVQVQAFVRGPVQPETEAFHLLRHRRADRRPTLQLGLQAGELHVQVRDALHEQLVELRLAVRDRDGRVRWVRPTGELCDHPVVARAELKLFDSGVRAVELMRWRPDEDVVEVEAVLLNPGALGEDAFALASEKTSWRR